MYAAQSEGMHDQLKELCCSNTAAELKGTRVAHSKVRVSLIQKYACRSFKSTRVAHSKVRVSLIQKYACRSFKGMHVAHPKVRVPLIQKYACCSFKSTLTAQRHAAKMLLLNGKICLPLQRLNCLFCLLKISIRITPA